MKLTVISTTIAGELIADRLKEGLDFVFFSKDEVKEKGIYNITKKAFGESEALIFISSTGIAVRAIAKCLKDKTTDPAVIVIDSRGKYVISLLSGHIGGANRLTQSIANIIKSSPIITTASDNLNLDAPDLVAKENNLIIDNMTLCKDITALLIEGKNIAFIDEYNNILPPRGYFKELELADALIYVTNKKNICPEYKNIKTLKLIRKNVILGIGCKRDYSKEEMINNIKNKLIEQNIDERAIKAIATIELKRNEKAIIEAVKYFNCDFKLFSVDRICEIENNFKGSDFVKNNIGVRAVCEPVVELSGGKIILEKQNVNGMTLCIGILQIKGE